MIHPLNDTQRKFGRKLFVNIYYQVRKKNQVNLKPNYGIHFHICHQNLESFYIKARARKSIKPASVAKTRSRLKRRTLPRARSLSTENETSKTSGYSTSNHHSMERLPTLSAFDEERIVSENPFIL